MKTFLGYSFRENRLNDLALLSDHRSIRVGPEDVLNTCLLNSFYGLAYKYATIRAIRLYRPDATKPARRVQQFADKDVSKLPLLTDLRRKFKVFLTRPRIGHNQITHGYLMSKIDPPMSITRHPSIDQTHNDGIPYKHRIQNNRKTFRTSIRISWPQHILIHSHHRFHRKSE
ncbi:hypothetical protein QTP88_019049 [Uroleucon formosanum]